MTAVETKALERTLSAQIMQGGAKPTIRRVKAGTALVRQGETGSEVFLLLDGVLRVEEDGRRLAEYGPGALLGERAHLEGGQRTSTLVAVTPCRVAAVEAAELDRGALQELSEGSPPDASRPELSRLRIRFCGVRGSTPAPGIDFVRYGGHTSCLALAHDGAPAPTLILDAGAGLQTVSGLLAARRSPARSCSATCTGITSLGLPFFAAGDRAGRARHRPAPRAAERRGRGDGARRGDVPALLPDRTDRAAGAGGRSRRSRRADGRSRASPCSRGRSRTRGAGRSDTG